MGGFHCPLARGLKEALLDTSVVLTLKTSLQWQGASFRQPARKGTIKKDWLLPVPSYPVAGAHTDGRAARLLLVRWESQME